MVDTLLVIIFVAIAIACGSIFALTMYVRSSYHQAIQRMSTGKPQEALDLLIRVVGWQGKHVPALWQLALLHLSTDKTEAAVRYLEKIIRIMDAAPDKASAAARWEVTEPQVLTKLAWSLAKLNKRPEAIACFKRLVDLDPNNKEARFELAKLFYSTRNYDECVPMLESVIRLDPSFLDAFESLSHALSAKGEHARAAEILSQRLATDKQNVNLWIRLANLYRTAGDNTKQAEAWKTVMEITPDHDSNHIHAVVQLGKIAYAEGHYEEAVSILNRGADLCPLTDAATVKSIHYYIGRGYEELGRKPEARSAFARVYEMDRSYKDIRDLLRESYELLSDDDLAEELNRMGKDEFTDLSVSIVGKLGYQMTSVDTVNDTDIKVNGKLEETGAKDRMALVYFNRGGEVDVGELSIRTFLIECEERHIEYPIFFTTGGFSFEAQLKAKDHRLRLMPRREFCEIIRLARSGL